MSAHICRSCNIVFDCGYGAHCSSEFELIDCPTCLKKYQNGLLCYYGDKLKTRALITRETLNEYTSDLAEIEHHKTCEFSCCGEHNDFSDFNKCPDCNMTPEQQEDHNDQVWQLIDQFEFNLLSTRFEVKEN
ncbi:hypothetical protein QIT55_gp47 [Nitrosopumilus spindle-shaped virus]|uniref:Uncharacterized protein n=1 Tax=Nitrosopumilus spindle-shaped virus 1 TaxID=2848002 RepID=A0A514K326_9VIRU|nr:hypothetical protein QIT55_gp47 [Nitrosopumilus spindle-shaped virus]QDI74033.1 hypothetical protein [Nitrosopumilus spindle-shaped virus]